MRRQAVKSKRPKLSYFNRRESTSRSLLRLKLTKKLKLNWKEP